MMHTFDDLKATLQKQMDELLMYSCDDGGFASFWEKFAGWCKEMKLPVDLFFEKDNTCIIQIDGGNPLLGFRFYKGSLYSFFENFNEKLGRFFSKDYKRPGRPYGEAKAIKDRMYKILDLYKRTRDYYYDEDDNGE